jgi:hypothetical protein
VEKDRPVKKAGRPQEPVPQDKADSLVDWISNGETLRDWCRENGVGFSTVYDWMAKDEIFAGRIARARDVGEEVIAQECMEIADDARNDWMEKKNEDGEKTGVEFNKEHVQRSKLRIETRLKLLAKWNPKKWGDRQQIEHSGNIGLESLIAGE